MSIDRVRAGELGLSEKEIVDNMITALTSNGMIAPNYWVDPKSGNDYLLTVQYFENKREESRRPGGDPAPRRPIEDAREPRRGHPRARISIRRPRSTITSFAASSTSTSRPKGEDLSRCDARVADDHRGHAVSGERPRQRARFGAGDAIVVQEFRTSAWFFRHCSST